MSNNSLLTNKQQKEQYVLLAIADLGFAAYKE